MKKITVWFLVFVLMISALFTVVSCGDEPPTEDCLHADGNADGRCDLCDALMEAEEMIDLIRDGEVKFQFVLAQTVPAMVGKTIDTLTKTFQAAGMNVQWVWDKADNETEIEILIGPVQNRAAAYTYDMYSLGMDGYMIRAVDQKKVLITAGSTIALTYAVTTFVRDILCIGDGTSFVPVRDLSVPETLDIFHPQTEYSIASLSINGKNVKESHMLLATLSDPEVYKTAVTFQNKLYERCGIYLELKDCAKATEEERARAIIMEWVDDAGPDGHRVSVKGHSLIFETEFPDTLFEEVFDFLSEEIEAKGGDVNFSADYTATSPVRNVYYQDFGAVGDGKTDDYDAIVKAHAYANTYGHTVCAADSSGKTDYTYYIGDTGTQVARIMSDVIWGDATFLVDDTAFSVDAPARSNPIFRIVPNTPAVEYGLNAPERALIAGADGSLRVGTTKLDYAPGYPAMLILYNNNHLQYKRYGDLETGGAIQHEIILIDADGNIDPSTPLLFDFEEITKVLEIRADEKPITIDGGIFITKANAAECEYNYYMRNIVVNRCNVTMKNLTHRITDEGPTGAPYNGFISQTQMNHFRLENASLQSHKVYREKNAPHTNMGTYDIDANCANDLYYKDCVQTNFFKDEATKTPYDTLERWGIMGSNYCKNITYDHSRLSRLDAHRGVYNASIINGSEVQMIYLIGDGTVTIKDSTVYSQTLISLRTDYGSTWNGDVIVENVTMRTNASNVCIISAFHNNFDFGYPTVMGRKIVIKDLKLEGNATSVYIFKDPTTGTYDPSADRLPLAYKYDTEGADEDGLYKNYNPCTLPEEVILVDFGYAYTSASDDFYKAHIDGVLKEMTAEQYAEHVKHGQ